MAKTHDTPSDVAAEAGDVHVEGPDGVVYSMTPAAAEETSNRLIDGAAEAQGQRNEVKRQEDERNAR